MSRLKGPEQERKKAADHARDLERVMRALAVYVLALLFLVCLIKGGGNVSQCCGPVNAFIGGTAAARTTSGGIIIDPSMPTPEP